MEPYDRKDLLLQIKDVIPINTETLSISEVVWCVLDEVDIVDANNALKRALNEE